MQRVANARLAGDALRKKLPLQPLLANIPQVGGCSCRRERMDNVTHFPLAGAD